MTVFRLPIKAPVAGRATQSMYYHPAELSALSGRQRRRSSFRYAAASGLWGLGQTRFRASEADRIAMDAPDEDLPRLCREGNRLACELAGRPQLTQADLEAMAQEVERQAQAEREHTARKLESAGVSPKITQAVREGRDVVYTGRGGGTEGELSLQAQVALARGAQTQSAAAVVRTPRSEPTRSVSAKLSPGGGALTFQQQQALIALAIGQQQKKTISGGSVAVIAVAGVVGLGLLALVLRR